MTAPPAAPRTSPATARRLRGLRVRMTLLITALAAIVVAVFAVVVVRLDRDLRDEQLEGELLRRLDEVSRTIDFTEGELTGADPQVLDTDVAIGVRPDFDIIRILDERDLWAEIEEPDDDDLRFLLEGIFFDFDRGLQEELLQRFVRDEFGDLGRDEEIELLLADPPEELLDETYRAYVTESAIEADVDLEIRTELLVTDDELVVPEPVFLAAADAVLDDEVDDTARVDGATGERWLRGTVIRDGAEARGAIVAAIDPAPARDAHDDLRTGVTVVAVLLVAGAAGAAWFVAGRTAAPVAQALAQQERFLADAAHELRTPVTAIRATAETPMIDAADAAARLDRIAELAGGASQLTDDLLTLARMDAERVELRTEPTRLDLLVEALVDEEPAVGFRADAEVVAEVDAGLIERAVANLVRNAVAHGEASPSEPAEVVVDRTGVSVTDHGPGVHPNLDVFERFASARGSRGHGLGLPLARWIARAHGGDLTVGAGPGDRGAHFHLQLPTRTDTTPTRAEPSIDS